MALSTLGGIGHLPSLISSRNRSAIYICNRTGIAGFPCMEVQLMTLQAQEGLILYEQVIGYGSVGIVADGTIFYYRLMFKGKRPLLGGVTVEAEVIQSFISFEVCQKGAVRLMTVSAYHLSLSDRMVGRIKGFCPDVLVTIITELGLRLDQKPFGTRVGPVAVDT
jgi:hypothetical protein